MNEVTIVAFLNDPSSADLGDIWELVKNAKQYKCCLVSDERIDPIGEVIVVWDGPDTSPEELADLVVAELNGGDNMIRVS